jgi:hypothetical protein
MNAQLHKISAREVAVLSYWRASQRLIRDDARLRLSPARANVVLINQALDSSWPRLKTAAVVTLLMARRKTRRKKGRASAPLSTRGKSR